MPFTNRTRPEEWGARNFELAPYLVGVETLSDAAAALAARRRHSPDEQARLDAEIARVAAHIRLAREDWRREPASASANADDASAADDDWEWEQLWKAEGGRRGKSAKP